MAYEYTEAKRAGEPHALPDIEVFFDRVEYSECCQAPTHVGSEATECPSCEGRAKFTPIDDPETHGWRWWYAYGFPGCLWDSGPYGPYDSEESALTAARESAGYCAHGIAEDGICTDCPAPELWVLVDHTETLMVKPANPPHPARYCRPGETPAAWASEAGAKGSREHYETVHGLGPLHAIRLSEDEARRWGHEE